MQENSRGKKSMGEKQKYWIVLHIIHILLIAQLALSSLQETSSQTNPELTHTNATTQSLPSLVWMAPFLSGTPGTNVYILIG